MGCSRELRDSLRGGTVSSGSFQTLNGSAGWWHRLCSQGTVGKGEQEVVRKDESKPYDSTGLHWSSCFLRPLIFPAAFSTCPFLTAAFCFSAHSHSQQLSLKRSCRAWWIYQRGRTARHDLTLLLISEKQETALKEKPNKQNNGRSSDLDRFFFNH